MSEFWAVTDSQGDTPDEPIVVLKSDGPFVQVWVPHLNKWVDGPSYIESIYGDDRDAVSITEQQAAQYRSQGVGMDEAEYAGWLKWQDTYEQMVSSGEPAQP